MIKRLEDARRAVSRLGGLVLAAVPIAIIVAFAIVAFGAHAHGRSMGAFGGRPLDGTPWKCYAESAGAVTGSGAGGCVGVPLSASPRWEMNVPIENDGIWQIQYAAKGDGSIGPRCVGYGISQQSGIVTTSFPAPATTDVTYKVVTATVANVPAGGYLFLACESFFNSNVAVGSLNWGAPPCSTGSLCGGCDACNDGQCICAHVTSCANPFKPTCQSTNLCNGHGGVNPDVACVQQP